MASAVGLTMIVGLLFPILAFGQAQPQATQKGFCTQLSGILSKIDQRIVEKTGRLEAKRTERLNAFESRQNGREDKLNNSRVKWDTRRQEQYAKLESNSQTDGQKEAVRIFKEVVETAVGTRRATIDAAIASFQQEVDTAINFRKAAVDGVILAFTSAVKTAIEKAQSDCLAGVSAQTVRQEFRAALKSAKDKFQSDKTQVEKLRVSLESIITQKKQEVAKAIADFKAALEKAKTDFKAAFGQQ